MKEKYIEILQNIKEGYGMLDAMHHCQTVDGYLTEEAMEAIAKAYHVSPSHVYDTASFYSMIYLAPVAQVNIQVCRGAACHVKGAAKVIAAVEEKLGIKVGETTVDGKFSFQYTECLGQCQSAPSMLINGKLYTELTPDKVVELISKGGM